MIKILLTFSASLLIGLFFTNTAPLYADCSFSDSDIRSDFKNCNPDIGVRPNANIDLKATESNSDFREITAAVIRRVQIVTSVIAIGIIVWIGLVMVLPVSAEAKESAKSKVLSVVIGFLLMIAATIVVNGLINLLYDIFQ